MATKTITIDLEAYDRLVAARTRPQESFSRVIKRAHWPTAPKSCGALLELCGQLELLDAAALDRLEQAQHEDRPPEPKWTG